MVGAVIRCRYQFLVVFGSRHAVSPEPTRLQPARADPGTFNPGATSVTSLTVLQPSPPTARRRRNRLSTRTHPVGAQNAKTHISKQHLRKRPKLPDQCLAWNRAYAKAHPDDQSVGKYGNNSDIPFGIISHVSALVPPQHGRVSVPLQHGWHMQLLTKQKTCTLLRYSTEVVGLLTYWLRIGACDPTL